MSNEDSVPEGNIEEVTDTRPVEEIFPNLFRKPTLTNETQSNQYFQSLLIPASHPLEGLNPETVVKTVEDLQRDLKHLQSENALLYHFLEKNDPSALDNMESHIRQTHERTLGSTRRSSILSKSHRKSSYMSNLTVETDTKTAQSVDFSYAPSHTTHEMPKINLNQRTDLVLREMDEVHAEMQKQVKKAHDIKFNFDARIEEIDIRKEEILDSMDNLEKFRQAYEIVTLEKFLRFMDEWSKKSRLMVDKIRLRYSSLKVQYHKLTTTLAEKLLIGENLQEIDFEQLRIENLHIAEKNEKIAILLLELKKMTGAGNLQLSQHKRLLQTKIKQKEEILQAIARKEKDIAKSDKEISKLNVEVEEVKTEYERIKDLVSHYRAPDILDYIKTKAELDSLRRELKIWTRRKVFKDMALNTALSEMKRLLGGKKPDPDWFS